MGMSYMKELEVGESRRIRRQWGSLSGVRISSTRGPEGSAESVDTFELFDRKTYSEDEFCVDSGDGGQTSEEASELEIASKNGGLWILLAKLASLVTRIVSFTDFLKGNS